MRGLLKFALASLLGSALAAPFVKVHPGNAKDIIITQQDTVNPTKPYPTNGGNKTSSSNTSSVHTIEDVAQTSSNNGQLPLSFVNNFPGGGISAYVTGEGTNGNVVMLQRDGTFYYPSVDSNQTTPQLINAKVVIPLGSQGSTTSITLPGYIIAARVYFAEGELQFFTVYTVDGPGLVEPSALNPSDPSANVNWSFVELTNTADGGLYADVRYVDFVGLVLGMSLLGGDGSTQTAQGLQPKSVSAICNSLQQQGASDGQPWGNLCQVGSNNQPLRVIAPSDYISTNPSAFEDYYSDYVNSVWNLYSNGNTLTIDTQVAIGELACTVDSSSDLLTCAGDNRGYPKPTAADIFGCNSGAFDTEPGDNDVHAAVFPRLCAAFDRTTLTMAGGNIQPGLPASDYYQSSPTNWYSAFVHANEIDGKGYAFSFDDVTPDGGSNQSGTLTDANPQTLTVIVGGPS